MEGVKLALMFSVLLTLGTGTRSGENGLHHGRGSKLGSTFSQNFEHSWISTYGVKSAVDAFCMFAGRLIFFTVVGQHRLAFRQC